MTNESIAEFMIQNIEVLKIPKKVQNVIFIKLMIYLQKYHPTKNYIL